MVDVLVQQEKNSPKFKKRDQKYRLSNLLLSFDDVLEYLSYFCDHRHKESVICLVHKPLVILNLIVKLLLDVVFHLMRYESAGDFIGHLAQQSEVIRGKVLITLFVRDFEHSNGMISKLDWYQKHISHDLMQLLIHGHVLSKFIPHIIILSSFKVPSLASIKHLAEYVGIVALSLEADWLSQAPCNNFTEKLIFDTIVQEDRAALYIQQVR